MSKAADRKAKLRNDLIDAAEARIAADGVASLRARDLAADVGCSLGSIYNVFDDLHTLVLHANLRTLLHIEKVMIEAVSETDEKPVECLISLALAYFDFANHHTKPWRGLFDHIFPEGHDTPDWMFQGQIELLRHIRRPLRQIFPDRGDEETFFIAQTLFSAVHGVVELSLDDRTVGLPIKAVPGQLKLLVHSFVEGYAKSIEKGE
jgi:AcrR family transcriptional regulator